MKKPKCALCDKASRFRGLCFPHYRQMQYAGRLDEFPTIRCFSIESVMAKYTPTGLGDDECWEWMGCRKDTGYGQLTSGMRRHAAHRVALQLSGVRIPKGMNVLHSCDNPPCVNPRHLRVGTQAENSMDVAIRSRSGVRKLSDDDVREIRSLRGKMTISEIARRFGVGKSQVARIHKGQSRHHVPQIAK